MLRSCVLHSLDNIAVKSLLRGRDYGEDYIGFPLSEVSAQKVGTVAKLFYGVVDIFRSGSGDSRAVVPPLLQRLL